MADEFDPLKQTNETLAEPIYVNRPATLDKIKSQDDHRDDDLLRPQHELILKVEIDSKKSSTDEKPSEGIYQRLNHINTTSKVSVQSTNPFADDVKKSLTSTETNNKVSQQEKKHIESHEKTSDNDNDYNGKPYSDDYYNEYYEDSSYEKKGFSATLDRLVQRFPVLRIFYTPTSPPAVTEIYETGYGQDYIEGEVEGNEAPQLVPENSLPHELTNDDLALNGRYSSKLHAQIIPLQVTNETQPVDVCIHHETYTIYVCDIGRSVVEIFDMYGKLQHSIDDTMTTKFHPTAIAVTYDGTIIVSSHFSHRLQMYSPFVSEEAQSGAGNQTYSNEYHFQQYKLGSAGNDLEQFLFPAGISIDYTDGYLYICDRGNFRIKVLRPEGVSERIIELLSYDSEEYKIAPIQVAHQQIGDQLICITGKGEGLCFIPKYAEGPTYVEQFYVVDHDGLGLQGASGIAIDSEDRIFISDTGHHRIVICTPDGSYITHFGVEGNGLGELKRPCGIDITYDGTLVVADSANKRLQLFGLIREQVLEENKSTANESGDQNNTKQRY